MTSELAKVYSPREIEQEVYTKWIAAGAFHADPAAEGKRFCMVIPPPNVTAALHLGHALNNTLQDIVIRWRRMQQCNTLWMPGTDHAGIATQTVVEKRILAEEGKRRTDFERGEFVSRIQAWKDEYEARILGQLKLMGCSCDWDRTRFTMDEVCAKAVRAAFFKLFVDGLIYRGKRLVNWDPATQTVLADDEVEHEQVNGHFWYLKYPLTESITIDGARIEHVTVATTRPETMLGDTAVAMNPSDPRAKYLVGRKVRLPLVGREIPIVADEHVVLPNPDSEDEKARFSTGFLKVTPAHDVDDWAIGQRHGLAVINVMAPDGTISDKHGWTDWEQVKNPDLENLIGMDRFEAREAVVEFFRAEGLLAEVRDYVHQVGHSYRSHVPIEPYLSDQWYIAVKKPIAGNRQQATGNSKELIPGTDVPVNSLAGLALAPLLDGRLRFVPDRYAKNYQTWLENLRDWPISRQLWWGHQIPIWSKQCAANDMEIFHILDQVLPDVLENLLEEKSGDDCYLNIINLNTKEIIWPSVLTLNHGLDCPIMVYVALRDDKVVTALERNGFVRDTDVLDTWFSSALWPFSTLGWPEQTPELKAYYPGDVLCTAREIITLWVSRMVMMGQYCLGDIPFSDVFIHAMIQDGEGRKMSKSLGNGIDPLEVIDSHGADAMRFTLAAMTTQTQDVRMPVQEMKLPDGRTANTSPKFDLGRNFCNKLWNAARFAMMSLDGVPPWCDIRPRASLADAWILSRLNCAVRDATASLESYQFNVLADTLYHFVWDDFCDWYLEIAKGRIRAGEHAPKAILAHCLDVILRLLHPAAPFISEAIWSRLNEAAASRGPGGEAAEPLLIRAHWPQADAAAIDPAAEERFAVIQDLIRQVRNVRTQHNIPPSRKFDAVLEATGPAADAVAANVELIRSLANLGEVKVLREQAAPTENAASVSAGGARMHLLGMIDRDAELSRLNKQAQTLTAGIRGIQGKLDNESFVAKAPPAVVARERERLAGLQADLAAVQKSIDAIK